MKITLLQDVSPCRMIHICRGFEGACCLHLEGRRPWLVSILVPASGVHHYVIPQKLLLTNRLYFQQTSGIRAPMGKKRGCSLSGRSPAPIADSFHVATMTRKHSVLNLREINRNNTHTALASVLPYYG
jgi:hypothetical protein